MKMCDYYMNHQREHEKKFPEETDGVLLISIPRREKGFESESSDAYLERTGGSEVQLTFYPIRSGRG